MTTAPPPATPGRLKLPIGIQNLREMREQGYYYADKSGSAVDLIEGGKYYFLSRPRRFGKSLLLDTFKELFEGNRSLFQGLAAEDRWDWSRRHPVIRISFGSGVTLSGSAAAGPVQRLAQRIRGERAVVLIDEYDKPILDHITQPEAARMLRDGLRDLYATLKETDEHLRFVFLAGVSKFSKVGLFSGLNNLQDITLDARYSALCGYTDADVDTVFSPELPGLDRDEIRRLYNGYNWLGVSVYNPFDLLCGSAA